MTASIPVWVPVLFVALIALGIRQSRPREVRPGVLIGIAAAMFAFSLSGVIATFGAAPVPLLLWATGYALVVAVGRGWLSTRGMARRGGAVRVPGSWVPMALLMGIFAAKFVLGWAAGVHAPVLASLWFVAAMSALLGMLSGGFGARAVAVRQFASAAAPA